MDTVSDILSLEVGSIFGRIEIKEKEDNKKQDKKLGIIKMMGSKKFIDKKLDSICFDNLEPAELERRLRSLHDEFKVTTQIPKKSKPDLRKSIPLLNLNKILRSSKFIDVNPNLQKDLNIKESKMSKILSDFHKNKVIKPSGRSVFNKDKLKTLSKIKSEEFDEYSDNSKNDSYQQTSSYLHLIDKIYPITDREKEHSLEKYKEYYNIHQENANNMNSHISNKSYSVKRSNSNLKLNIQDQDKNSSSNSLSQKRPSFKKFFINDRYSKYYSLMEMAHSNPKMSRLAYKYLKETYNLPSPDYKLFTTLEEYQDLQTNSRNNLNNEKSKKGLLEKNNNENSIKSFPNLDTRKNIYSRSRNIRLLKIHLNGVSTAKHSTNYKSGSGYSGKKELSKNTINSLNINSELKLKQNINKESSKKVILEICEENIKDSETLFKDNFRNYENQSNLIEETLKKTLNFKDNDFEKFMAKDAKEKLENHRLYFNGNKYVNNTKNEIKKYKK